MNPVKSLFTRKLVAILLLASLSITTLSFTPLPQSASQTFNSPLAQAGEISATWTLDFLLSPSSGQVDALGGPDQANAQIRSMLDSKNLGQYGTSYDVQNGEAGTFLVTLTGSGTVNALRDFLYREIAPELDVLDGVVAVEVSAPVQAGQQIPVILESRPSTGYAWTLVEGDSNLVRQAQEPLLQSQIDRPSAPAQTTITLQGSADGMATIRLVYSRPWESSATPTRHIRVTLAEFPGQINLSNPAEPQAAAAAELPGPEVSEPTVGLPAHFDWRDQGKVPGVRDQGSCGSCWAFGTVAAMESAMLVQGGVSADLSEQFLLSCNRDGYSCNGGWWAHAYHQSTLGTNQSQPGAVLESTMPYRASQVSCGSAYSHPYRIGSWGYVAGNSNSIPSPDQIKNAIYQYGSVAVSVCSGNAWGGYSGGVFSTNETSQCGGSGQVNHAVQLVGWDDAGQYWILRNSWGPNWGENGFMRIKWGTSNVGYGASYVVYSGGTSPTQPAPTATKVAPTATPTKPAPTAIPVGPRPANDSINTPQVIEYSGGPVSFSQTLDVTGATSETTDPKIPLTTPIKGYNTVWYSFTPAYKGSLKIKTAGSSYDTILAMWTRTSTGSLKSIKVSDNYNSTRQSYISTSSLTPGTTYLIEVASRKSTGGKLAFALSYTPNTPSNNRISSAATIKPASTGKVTSYRSLLDVYKATVTTDEPVIPNGSGRGYHTVWYKFKPTQTGSIGVQTTGSNYNTILTIYRYSNSKWVAMGMNDDWSGLQSGFQVQLKAGTTYLIGVVSVDSSGPSKLVFNMTYTPQ